MQFKEALRAAGLSRPGRTTWCKVASDGTPVFTIWFHDIRQVDDRFFAWWEHGDLQYPTPTATAVQINKRRSFVKLAAAHLGRACRGVIVHRKGPDSWDVGAADYPHPELAVVRFRSADVDAIQFIAELSPS
jgi:hypothetical protein